MECLQLTQWPIPQGETEDEVRKSPVFCDSCWNLYPPAANTAAFTPNVHTISGNRQEEAVRRALGESYDHAAYERSLIEHTPFNFDLRLVDLRDAILKGCNSCLMLKTMVSKLSKAPINHDDNQLRLSITMCKGDALRISFRRETGPEADQALLFGFDHESDGGEDYTSEHIASWELYTLPGRFSLTYASSTTANC
jgi:hypothetical protein